jgi:hypothetical protein
MTSAVAETADVKTGFARTLAVFERTEGWCYRESAAIWDALLSLQEKRRVLGHMLEIGVWKGKTAALIVDHARPGRELCFLVDKFLDEVAVRQTLTQVRPELGDDVKLIGADSRAIPGSPLMSEGYRQFRWIHVDGEHSGGAVLNDLAVANQLLADAGVVCVDDFFSWMYPQITDAVLRFVREHPEQLTLFLCGFNKAYLARPHAVHGYLEYCRDRIVADIEERGFNTTLAKTTWPAEMNCFGIGLRSEGLRQRGPDWDLGVIRV